MSENIIDLLTEDLVEIKVTLSSTTGKHVIEISGNSGTVAKTFKSKSESVSDLLKTTGAMCITYAQTIMDVQPATKVSTRAVEPSQEETPKMKRNPDADVSVKPATKIDDSVEKLPARNAGKAKEAVKDAVDKATSKAPAKKEEAGYSDKDDDDDAF